MKKILLNPTDMLVSLLDDYYTKDNSFTITEKADYSVGVIEAVGLDLDESLIGKIIYFHRDIGEKIDLKNIGKYILVTQSMKLLIRLDQNKNNY